MPPARPVLYILEDEKVIHPGITEAEFKSAVRKWELKNHPDKGGAHDRYTSNKAHIAEMEKKMDMRSVRRYYNASARLEEKLREIGVPASQITTQLAQFAHATWKKHQLLRPYYMTLRKLLERKNCEASEIAAFISELKTSSDVARVPKPSRPRRLSWVKPTPRASNCRRCSSTASSTGKRCKLSASCRIGCEVKCWLHASKHVTQTSCRD